MAHIVTVAIESKERFLRKNADLMEFIAHHPPSPSREESGAWTPEERRAFVESRVMLIWSEPYSETRWAEVKIGMIINIPLI